jgi:AraC family ethanolamine operon transcriptional activator
MIDLDGLTLSRLSVNRKVTDVTAIDEGTLAFVVCLGVKTWCGNEVDPGSLVVLGPGQDYRSILEPGWLSIEIWASIDRMVAEGLPIDVLLAKERQLKVYPLPPHLLHEYRRIVGLVFGVDAARVQPNPIELLALRITVIDLLCETAAHIEAPGFMPAAVRRRSGYRLAATAMEFVERNPNSPIAVGEVAEALGVSHRALNYAFNQVLGLSIYRYMLTYRLNATRRELRAVSRRSTSVTDIAMNSDFYHLGRFADHYNRLFGELPSQTRNE